MKIVFFATLLLITASLGDPIEQEDTGAAVDGQKPVTIELAFQNVIGGHGAIVVDLVLKNNDEAPIKVPKQGMGRIFYRIEDATGKVYSMTMTQMFRLPRNDKDLEIGVRREYTLRCELRPQHWVDAACPIGSHTFFLPKGVQPFVKGEQAWTYPVKLTATMTKRLGQGESSPDAYRSKTIEVSANVELQR